MYAMVVVQEEASCCSPKMEMMRGNASIQIPKKGVHVHTLHTARASFFAQTLPLIHHQPETSKEILGIPGFKRKNTPSNKLGIP